jgi:hypothetical protein
VLVVPKYNLLFALMVTLVGAGVTAIPSNVAEVKVRVAVVAPIATAAVLVIKYLIGVALQLTVF